MHEAVRASSSGRQVTRIREVTVPALLGAVSLGQECRCKRLLRATGCEGRPVTLGGVPCAARPPRGEQHV